jgi:hypothetical protein
MAPLVPLEHALGAIGTGEPEPSAAAMAAEENAISSPPLRSILA